MTKKQVFGVCEMCKVAKMTTPHLTVCGPCDKAMAAEYDAIDRVKANAWAAKHKCRTCGHGLALNRYFHCEVCVVVMEREGDFDDSPDMHSTRETRVMKPRVRVFVERKTCDKCGVEKEAARFSKQKHNKDGLTSTCTVCRYKRQKERAAERAAARVEAA